MRVVTLMLLAAFGFLALAPPGGAAPLGMAAAAIPTAAVWVRRGRPGSLAALAAPTLVAAAIGWALAALALPASVAAWETMLGRAVTEGGQTALAQYRALGVGADTLDLFERTIAWASAWVVRLWPALTALALWLGAWLGGRLLARWGRIAPELAERLSGRFTEFTAGEHAVWLLIVALAGLWVPAEPVARVAANAAVVAVAVFALDGLAVTGWWLNRRRLSRPLALALAALAVVFALPLTAIAMVALGLADPWIRFRDRSRRPRPAGPVQR